jgi:hypothetical protein
MEFKMNVTSQSGITSANHHPIVKDPDDGPNFEPDSGAAPDLEYRGGKVLTNPAISSIYLGSYWNTVQGKNDSKFEDGFAKYLGQSKYTSVWAQYGVGKGSFLGSSTAATTTTPKSVNEAQIKQIVAKQIASGSAPKPDGKTIYTVYLPPGAVLKAPGATSLQGLGGYHGSYNDPKTGQKVYYAAIAYSKGNNGIDFTGKAQDNISITASHEWTEAATDPDVNNGKLGWYDDNLGEVADIPINQGMDLDDVYGKMGGYAVQKLWSDTDGQNEIAAKHPGKVVTPQAE